MRFKEFLLEDKTADVQKVIDQFVSKNPYNSFAMDLENMKIQDGWIEPFNNTLYISKEFLDGFDELLFPFRSLESIIIMAQSLRSFKNFPLEIKGSHNGRDVFKTQGFLDGHRIESWDGFPSKITGSVYLHHPKFWELNFSHWNKVVHTLNGALSLHEDYRGPLLSLLLVKELKLLVNHMSEPWDTISGIINSHLRGDKDILDCQEELIQAGYKGCAKI